MGMSNFQNFSLSHLLKITLKITDKTGKFTKDVFHAGTNQAPRFGTDYSETTLQPAEITSGFIDKKTKHGLFITGEYIDQSKCRTLTIVSQICNFNVRRRLTFHPSTPSNSSFSDLQPRRGRFCHWKGHPKKHGSRHYRLNCKNSVEIKFAFGF